MKNLALSIIAALAIISFAACSGSDYNANLNTQANNSANPLNPLDSAGFNWTGVDPISVKINGVQFIGDSASTYYSFSLGFNDILSTKDVQAMILQLKDVWGGNIYDVGFHQYNTFGEWSDSIGSSNKTYFSYLGNVGQVQVLRNDATRFMGKFYFQAISPTGQIINASEGWFNVHK